jgi:hypothetical protein
MIIIHAVYVRDPKDVMATCAQPRLTSKQKEAEILTTHLNGATFFAL